MRERKRTVCFLLSAELNSSGLPGVSWAASRRGLGAQAFVRSVFCTVLSQVLVSVMVLLFSAFHRPGG